MRNHKIYNSGGQTNTKKVVCIPKMSKAGQNKNYYIFPKCVVIKSSQREEVLSNFFFKRNMT